MCLRTLKCGMQAISLGITSARSAAQRVFDPLLEDTQLSGSKKSGVCLTPDERELVQRHTQNHLLTPVSGKVRNIDIDVAFRSGNARNDNPKLVEFYQQGVAIDALKERPDLYDRRLEILQGAAEEVLAVWLSAKKANPIIQHHHTSPPKLDGLWTPRVSRRTDLSPTPLAREAAQTLSGTPFVVNREMDNLFWEVRGNIPLGNTENTRFSAQESFYPYRLRPMATATEYEPFYVAMSTFCWALRMYAKSAGTLHPMFGQQCRAMMELAYPVPIDHQHWVFFKSWLKRHFAGKASLKDWCGSILSDPKASLLAGATGKGGCGAYEYAAALEFSRLERLPMKDRQSRFLMELDTEGSGPKFIELMTGEDLSLALIDVLNEAYQHPRKVLLAFIRELGLPFLASLPPSVMLLILKKIFSPKTYGSGAGPVFDALVGQHGLREGFTSLDDLSEMPAALRNALLHGEPHHLLVYTKVKKMSQQLSEAFNDCFPTLSKANRDALKEWDATPWDQRFIGGDLLMSPYRFKSSDDSNVEQHETGSSKKGNWKVHTSYISHVTGKETNGSCRVDRAELSDAGTALLARRLHMKDAEHRCGTVLTFKDMSVHGGNMYGIHDAGGCPVGDALTYVKADSQALIDLFPDACKKIGFTTESRICN